MMQDEDYLLSLQEQRPSLPLLDCSKASTFVSMANNKRRGDSTAQFTFYKLQLPKVWPQLPSVGSSLACVCHRVFAVCLLGHADLCKA